MYHHGRALALCFLSLLALGSPVHAQSAATPATDAPAIRRWLDVQSIHAASRFRWIENSAGRITSSSIQWQTQQRARFLFDKAGRYHVGAFATTGNAFQSGWNNTGAGIGTFSRPFALRHLYLSAEPIKGLEVQAGGLALNRGLLNEQIAYDSDSFIVGERATIRPARGPVPQVSFTAGHIGDLREPNVFKRLDKLDDVNYAQALINFRFGARVTASLDLTHEDGREIIREGVHLRIPQGTRLLTLLKVEAYQRVDPDAGQGFNVAADGALGKLAFTTGVMHVDAAYGPYNGDRYETGTRYYSLLNYPVTSQLSLQLYHTKAFDNDFPVALDHRLDLVAIFNPTAALKRAGVF